jgi:hypothetical protein
MSWVSNSSLERAVGVAQRNRDRARGARRVAVPDLIDFANRDDPRERPRHVLGVPIDVQGLLTTTVHLTEMMNAVSIAVLVASIACALEH